MFTIGGILREYRADTYDSQAAIKALNSYDIYPKLIWVIQESKNNKTTTY